MNLLRCAVLMLRPHICGTVCTCSDACGDSLVWRAVSLENADMMLTAGAYRAAAVLSPTR